MVWSKTKKIWFIMIYGEKEGPYSFMDLKSDTRITPSTLVWRKGFDSWKPICEVPELKELIEEEEYVGATDQELVLDAKKMNPNILFLFLILGVLITYIFYQIYFLIK